MEQGTDSKQDFSYDISKQVTGDSGEWIPYEGPEGGEGWQRAGDGEVRYQDHPPGDTPDNVDDDFWGKPEADMTDLSNFLADNGFDRATTESIWEEIKNASNNTGRKRDEIASYVLGRLQHRVQRFDNDFSEATDEQMTRLAGKILEEYQEEILDWEEMDELGRLIAENDNLGDREANWISSAVDRVQEITEYSEEALRQDLLETAQNGDMPLQYELDRVGIKEWADGIIATWREEHFDPLESIDLPEEYDTDDIRKQHVHDAISQIKNVSIFDLDTRHNTHLEAAIDAIEDEYGEDVNEFHDRVEEFNEALESVLVPFSNTQTSAPDFLDPRNAEDVFKLSEKIDKTGRSSSSMFIAEGVPDEDGEERDLFVTNTNRNRTGARAQRSQDGQRQLLGAEGFREAGFDTPHCHNEPGEFWVVEEVEGDTADEFVFVDLDNPEEQFVDLFATGMVLGTWDLHEGNVFVSDGELVPVDMDLAGAKLDYRANETENRYHAAQYGMMGIWGRFDRLLGAMDADQYTDKNRLRKRVKERVREMAETGEVDEIADAALKEASSRELRNNIERNRDKIKEHEFFKHLPPSIDSLEGYDEITDLETGQEVEVLDRDRDGVSRQRFEVTEVYDNSVEVTAVDDGEILGEGEKWNVNDLDDIGGITEPSNEEVSETNYDDWEVRDPEGYEESEDFDEGQVIEVTNQGGPMRARVLGGEKGWLQLETLDGEYELGEKVENVTGILEPPDSNGEMGTVEERMEDGSNADLFPGDDE